MYKTLIKNIISQTINAIFSNSKYGINVNNSKIKNIKKDISKNVNLAIKHDSDLFKYNSVIVNDFRALIRPSITIIMCIWYIYSKIKGIVLTNQDYTIIFSVVIFWFGARSIEKNINN